MAEHLVNAVVSLEAARSVLGQEGQHEAVNALRGLELLDPASANMAFGLLSSIPVYGTAAQSAKREALNALRLATTQLNPRA